MATALAMDMSAFDDVAEPSPEAAMVRGRDGKLRLVDVSRLAWPDERAAAGVDYVADLMRRGPTGRC